LVDKIGKRETATSLIFSDVAVFGCAQSRRTFIGNLYRQVKDPSLIGSMTGHVEGSRAFARYRSIDDEIKADVVRLLEKK